MLNGPYPDHNDTTIKYTAEEVERAILASKVVASQYGRTVRSYSEDEERRAKSKVWQRMQAMEKLGRK